MHHKSSEALKIQNCQSHVKAFTAADSIIVLNQLTRNVVHLFAQLHEIWNSLGERLKPLQRLFLCCRSKETENQG